MKLCAHAHNTELLSALDEVNFSGIVKDIRVPETGLVMARGRIGGDGSAFNFGEVTTIRAAIVLESGIKGFAYHLGRDSDKVRNAAIIDALFQSADYAKRVQEALAPVKKRLDEDSLKLRQRIEATKVNFFTMVRGEDE